MAKSAHSARPGGSPVPLISGIVVLAAAVAAGVWWQGRQAPAPAGEPAAAAAGAGAPAAESPAAPAAATPPVVARSAAKAAAPTPAEPDIPPVPLVEVEDPAAGRTSDAAGEPERAAPSPVTPDLAIYSASSANVVPPYVVNMQPLASSTAEPVRPDVSIEVVISERGTVESVKSMVKPRTMSEYIAITNGLSALKASRFEPATKDGQPVRYRLLVPLGPQ